jgi:lipoprotein-anchoring transpeptidase ErfK/SrfK
VTRNPSPSLAAIVVAAACAVLLSGCAGIDVHAGSGTGAGTAAASSSPAKPAPKLSLTSPAPWDSPLTVSVTQGALTSVVVTDKATSETLPGALDASTGHWVSTGNPSSGATYRVLASVVDGERTTTLSGAVKVMQQPDTAKIHFGILPGRGQTVGVNAPVVIRFDHKVTERAAVESALHVASSTPVVGAWHWINSEEIHFRPKSAWPAHTKVQVTFDFDGVKASDTRYGTRNATSLFTIGDAHQTIVNDKTHTFVFKVNGKVKYVWPTSLGKPLYETRTGNYIVLEKSPLKEMTSCGAKITCDKADPNYYDLKVQWDTRLSWSGTFIHAAPWDAAKQGLVDSSHGCIHLTTDRAKTYYDLAQYGDIVNVLHTSRKIDDLIQHGDPGVTDWNTTWPAWLSGSALGEEITTDPLTA